MLLLGATALAGAALSLGRDRKPVDRHLAHDLESQLHLSDSQVQALLNLRIVPVPSTVAVRLAAQIADDGPDLYAQALKAIAQRRFQRASQLLVRVEAAKQIELGRVYRTHGDLEYYAGHFKVGCEWYQKALDLYDRWPNSLGNGAALARQVHSLKRFVEEEQQPRMRVITVTTSEYIADTDYPFHAIYEYIDGNHYLRLDRRWAYMGPYPADDDGLVRVDWEYCHGHLSARQAAHRALELGWNWPTRRGEDFGLMLHILCMDFLRYGDEDVAEDLLQRAIPDSPIDGNERTEQFERRTLAVDLGDLYVISGKDAQADKMYSATLPDYPISSDKHDFESARCYDGLACVAAAQGHLDVALSLYRKALLAEPDSRIRAVSLNNLGCLCYQRANYQAAMSYFKQAREQTLHVEGLTGDNDSKAQDWNPTSELCSAICRNNIAVVCYRQGNDSTAQELLSEAYTVVQRLGKASRRYTPIIAGNLHDAHANRRP